MANDTFQSSVSVEWIDSDEQPFVPKQGTTVFAELTPLEKDNQTFWEPSYIKEWGTWQPPFIPSYEALPDFEAPAGELIINLETTGAKPWESKLIMIGVLDPNALEPTALNFMEETELETLETFLQWFDETGYDELVAYNVAFDYRFLYVLMQKYRKIVPRWTEIKLYDLMQQQEQVKPKFVPGRNPSGSLQDWSTYLFGIPPYAPQAAVNKWLKEGNVQELMNFNTDKLQKSYLLWVLNKLVSGNLPGAEILARPSSPTEETPQGTTAPNPGEGAETVQVQCPICLQRQYMPKTAKVISCHVCQTPISNPAI